MASFYDLTIGQQVEFHRILSNAGLSAEMVNGIIKTPSLAKKMLDALTLTLTLEQDKFAQYAHLLKSLDLQILELKELNKRMPKAMRVPDSWFNNLERDDEHVQSVQRLKFYFVVKDTIEETLAYNWKLIELTQPAIYHSGFSTSADRLRLDETARKYSKGIHLVEINLVDNWSPDEGRSVDQVRINAIKIGQKLAGVEAIAAYALQDPKLLQAQDGKNLPYCDLAGLQQGGGFGQVLGFYWDSSDRKACLDSWGSGSVDLGSAAPSVAA